MTLQKRDTTRYLFVAGCIAVAVMLRQISMIAGERWNDSLLILRSLIYIFLFFYWGYWIRRRLVHRQIRTAIIGIDRLIILWFVLRCLKYHVVNDPTFLRYLWYGYYFAMLFIPVLSLIAALSIGKSESYEIPKRLGALFFVSLGLFLMILTNDLHQYVFVFHTIPFSDHYYNYGSLYYLVLCWILVMSLLALIIIVRHCRIPNQKRYQVLPLIPIVLMMGYTVIYILTDQVPIFADLTTFNAVCIATFYECCLNTGLIQSNRYYQELASASSVDMLIVDQDYRPFLGVLTEERRLTLGDALAKAEVMPIILEDKLRLSSNGISRGGRVFWTEDVSKSQEILHQLEDAAEYLEDRTEARRRANQAREEAIELMEKNQLYDLLLDHLSPFILEYRALIEQTAVTTDSHQERYTITRIGLILTYIKRRSNLFFLSLTEGQIMAQELYFCLNETLENLNILGIMGHCTVNLYTPMEYTQMTELYDVIQTILMKTLDGLTAVFISVVEGPAIKVRLLYNGALPDFGIPVVAEQDEEEWILSYLCKKEGGHPCS